MNIFTKHITRLIAVLTIAVLAFGCGGEPVQTLKIGVVVPLSGGLAAYGENTLEGVKLMADQINAQGGIDGKMIELVVENNEGDPTKTANAVRKLVAIDKVLAIIGPITSTNALAVGRDANSKMTVLLSPTATNDKVTAQGQYVFRTCFTDSFQGVAVAKFAYNDLGIKKAVPFEDTASDYSVGLCKSFAGTFNSLGGDANEKLAYKTGDIEFTAQLRKIRDMKAGAAFIPGYPPELPMIVNEAKALGLETVLLGADGWDSDDLTKNSGKNLEGTYFSAAFSPDNPTPALQAFLKLATENEIEQPGTFEALGYDSLGLIAEAIRVAGSDAIADADLADARSMLRDNLAAIQAYEGATGQINMQESGDPLKSLVILKYTTDESGQVAKEFVQAVNP